MSICFNKLACIIIGCALWLPTKTHAILNIKTVGNRIICWPISWEKQDYRSFLIEQTIATANSAIVFRVLDEEGQKTAKSHRRPEKHPSLRVREKNAKKHFALKVSEPPMAVIDSLSDLSYETIISRHTNRFAIPELFYNAADRKQRIQLIPFCKTGDLSQFICNADISSRLTECSLLSAKEDLSSTESLEAQCTERYNSVPKNIEANFSLQREKMIFQIADSLALMHQQKYAHTSIKPANILISEKQIHSHFPFYRSTFIDFDTCTQYRFARITYSHASTKQPAHDIPLFQGTALALNAHHLASRKTWNIYSPFLHDIDGLTRVILYLTTGQSRYSGKKPPDLAQEIKKREAELTPWFKPMQQNNHKKLKECIKASIGELPTPDHRLFLKFLPFLATLQLPPFSRLKMTFDSLSEAIKKEHAFKPFLTFATSLRLFHGEDKDKGLHFSIPKKFFSHLQDNLNIALQLITCAYERLTGFIITLDEATAIAAMEKSLPPCWPQSLSPDTHLIDLLCYHLELYVDLNLEHLTYSTDVFPDYNGLPLQEVYPNIEITHSREHYTIKITHPERIEMVY